MIIDNIDNAGLYYGISDGIKKGLEYISKVDAENIEPGKYVINDDIYVLVLCYDTKTIEESKWEAHKKYIDIQYVVSGKELMGYAYSTTLNEVTSYDESADFLFLEGGGTMFECTARTFVIFFPDDAHMPSVSGNGPNKVKKIVVKVKHE